MPFAWVFEPAFTGLGILFALALAALLLPSSDHDQDPYPSDMTTRWRRRK